MPHLETLRSTLLKFATISAAMLSSMQPVWAATAYVVEQGDTVSNVLYKRGLKPLYGRNGSVAQIVVLNPSLSPLASVIKPGQIIYLPDGTRKLTDDTFKRELSSIEETLASQVVEVKPKSDAEYGSPISSVKPRKPSSQAQVKLGAGYYALNGVDPSNGSRARLLSKLSSTLDGAWEQNWSDTVKSKIFIGLRSVSLQPEMRGIRLFNSSLLTSEIGLGVGGRLIPDLEWSIDLRVLEALFYRGVAEGGLELNQAPLLAVRPQLTWTLIRRSPLSLAALAAGDVLGSSRFADYTINAGYGYRVGLRLQQDFESSIFSCDFGYGERRQDTSLIRLVEKELRGGCAYSWGLGL